VAPPDLPGVAATTVAPVFAFKMTTRAPEITPPDASLTVSAIVPVSSWARQMDAHKTRTRIHVTFQQTGLWAHVKTSGLPCQEIS